MARHPLYENPDELEKKINEYFDLCDESGEIYSITGIALHCGFCSRQSFYAYKDKEKFSYILKKAQLKIENNYIKMVPNKKYSTGGIIFILKNMGWSDENTTIHKIDNGLPVNLVINRGKSQ